MKCIVVTRLPVSSLPGSAFPSCFQLASMNRLAFRPTDSTATVTTYPPTSVNSLLPRKSTSAFQPGMFPRVNSPPGNRQHPRKFSAGRNFLNGSYHTLLLECKKKPFVPDVRFLGAILAKTVHAAVARSVITDAVAV